LGIVGGLKQYYSCFKKQLNAPSMQEINIYIYIFLGVGLLDRIFFFFWCGGRLIR
jgi:hypothetical protein